MTDNEIIKALECCEENEGCRPNCNECPYFALREKPSTCYLMARKNALDLINRQKAEIKRLTVNMNAFGLGMKREAERADTARAEAVKEFAERLKEKGRTVTTGHGVVGTVVDDWDIDNLVKEMVGDTE